MSNLLLRPSQELQHSLSLAHSKNLAGVELVFERDRDAYAFVVALCHSLKDEWYTVGGSSSRDLIVHGLRWSITSNERRVFGGNGI